MGKKRYRRGAHTVTDFKYHFVWSRGYFGASVGAVNETQIKQYIEAQTDDPGSFKIWDEPDEPEDAEPESNSSENSDDFKS